jgi:hypothetical protein
MKRVDEVFRFCEKSVGIKNRRDQNLAERESLCFGIDGECGAGGVFQHILRFKKRYTEFLSAFRRWMAKISAKDDPVAFVEVVNGECAPIDFKDINTVWVALERYAQSRSELFYEFETVHLYALGL